jgi:hypothetical protein
MQESKHNWDKKWLVIWFSDTIVEPNAVMIEFWDTSKIIIQIPIALFTMFALFIAVAITKITKF